MSSYGDILRQAADISDDREPQYGEVIGQLHDTAMVAKAMFDIDTDPVTLAKIMIAFKTSRQKHAHKDDNLLDNINYHAILLLAIHSEAECRGADAPGAL